MKASKLSRLPVGVLVAALLAVILAVLFARSFLPDYVHFSNDGPLGQQHADWLKLPSGLFGIWNDLNDTGFSGGTYSPGITPALIWLLGPVGYAKFLAPVALFILGLGAWAFFRMLKLTTLAAALGAIATMLATPFFAGACWGVASLEIALGFDFLALALVVANNSETQWPLRWTRFSLAGLCVGVNVMEAADVGALCSIFIAGFVFFHSLVTRPGKAFTNACRGVGAVMVVAVFAGFIAMQTVLALIGTSVTGVAGLGPDAATKAANWDKATQFSLPKKETLSLFVPGLFGYRGDTPQDMLPALQDAYRGGIYWGGMGRSPEIDRFFDSGRTGNPPPGIMRFGYGGNYCGILVALVACWTVAQSFRRQNSPFTEVQKKFLWFWTAVLVVSLLLAWGRFAPGSATSDGFLFYALLYKLPHFSDIRNPAKFLVFFTLALLVLFAYGIHALSRLHLEVKPAAKGKMPAPKWDAFDRKWTLAGVGVWGACVLGWLVFAGNQPALVRYLQKVGFDDVDFARQIASFSVGQAGWFVALLAIAITLVTLTLNGFFAGPRVRLGTFLLGAFLVFDLGRADLPFIIHWNYVQKYDVDPANSSASTNPIINLLRDQPYEHRVAGLPFDPQQQLRLDDNYFGGNGLYRIEWMQHHFPYYNIQCLDIIQMSRMTQDLQAYLEALSPGSQAELPLFTRHWELTNTRYLLGAAGFLNVLNQQLDPARQRFRIVQRFDIVPKPGVNHITELAQLTAITNDDGDLAVFEFAGALPRAKLYERWQVNTNDAAVLKTLTNLNFDPARTLLVDTAATGLPTLATNENSGTVEIKHYAPKDVVLTATATAPAVLLLNDKYDPHWHVTVDGQPAELLRCNYLMRGVQVPPGTHTVEFRFSMPNKPLFVTLAAILAGFGLAGYLLIATKRSASRKP